MTAEELDQLVEALVRAEQQGRFLLPSSLQPDLTLDDAYAVQRGVAARRVAAGERLVGRKVAMVSPEKQREMGASEPVTGRLFESNRLDNGGSVREVAGDRAVVECELAFILSSDLSGPDVTEETVMAATEAIVPAFEVIERHWPEGTGMEDRIAVNYGVAGFLVGQSQVDPQQLDRVSTQIEFEMDGRVVSTGNLGVVLGDPARSVVWLANRMAGIGEGLQAGDIILTGTIVPSVPADTARTFRATYGGGLGTIELVGSG